MSVTSNIGLWLYSIGQKFRITQNSESLNDNFNKIDAAFGTKMDKPTNTGTLDQILRNNGQGGSEWGNAATQQEIGAAVTDWLDKNVPTGTTVVVDNSLSISGAAADAKKTGDGLSDLKSAFNSISSGTKNLIAGEPKTGKPVNVDVTYSGNGVFKINGTANSNGGRTTNVSGLITIPAGTYTLSAPYVSTQNLVAYLNDLTTNDNFAAVTVGGIPNTFTISEQKTFYVGFGFANGVTYNLDVNLQLENGNTASDFIPSLSAEDLIARTYSEDIKERIDDGFGLNDLNFTIPTLNLFASMFEPNIKIDSSGNIVSEVSANISAERDYIPVSASTAYCFYEKDRINYPGTFNVIISYYNSSKAFLSQENKGNSGVVRFTTPANTGFVRFYLWKPNISDYLSSWKFVLCAGNSPLPLYVPTLVIPSECVEGIGNIDDEVNLLLGKTALIFGDSITDCCSITINSSNQTTEYYFRNPSNSYTDAGGNTVNFSMWPKILLNNKHLGEIRNYAKFGATYKDGNPATGYERQNLSYQITVAENDISNPNGAFPTTGNFSPDIVIFALGINDGVPNDTPMSALAKLVRNEDDTINVQSSLANMDRTKFCEAVLWAFLKVKSLFPMAQGYCVTPLQSANRNTIPGTLHDYLKEMAERYNYIVIDGSYTSGITRELNNVSALGEYLIDGLHPNEKGQNLIARMIIKSLESHYMQLDGEGFN